jgi:hypothetical protein
MFVINFVWDLPLGNYLFPLYLDLKINFNDNSDNTSHELHMWVFKTIDASTLLPFHKHIFKILIPAVSSNH